MPVASAEAVLACSPPEDAAVAELRVGQLPADWAPADLVAPQAADRVRVDSVARQADALPLDDSSQDDSVEPTSAGSIPADSLSVRAARAERQVAVLAGPQAAGPGAEQVHAPQPVAPALEQAHGLWWAQPVSQEAQLSPLDALQPADANWPALFSPKALRDAQP